MLDLYKPAAEGAKILARSLRLRGRRTGQAGWPRSAAAGRAAGQRPAAAVSFFDAQLCQHFKRGSERNLDFGLHEHRDLVVELCTIHDTNRIFSLIHANTWVILPFQGGTERWLIDQLIQPSLHGDTAENELLKIAPLANGSRISDRSRVRGAGLSRAWEERRD